MKPSFWCMRDLKHWILLRERTVCLLWHSSVFYRPSGVMHSGSVQSPLISLRLQSFWRSHRVVTELQPPQCDGVLDSPAYPPGVHTIGPNDDSYYRHCWRPAGCDTAVERPSTVSSHTVTSNSGAHFQDLSSQEWRWNMLSLSYFTDIQHPRELMKYWLKYEPVW